MLNPENSFSKMQRKVYAEESAKWTPEDRDWVVGSWDEHEKWADYDLLFEGLDTSNMVALDFGCGPGRMIRRYAERFCSIDGVDIDPVNLENARKFTHKKGDNFSHFFYPTNGVDLGYISDTSYDLVYSTICLQHIPVHDIRMNLFREFFRVLKPGGWFTAQMGFGKKNDPRGVPYHANKWDTEVTNGGCDVQVTCQSQPAVDCIRCGFTNFDYKIRPAGPNDWHPNWIWFRCQKPKE